MLLGCDDSWQCEPRTMDDRGGLALRLVELTARGVSGHMVIQWWHDIVVYAVFITSTNLCMLM